ncbi:MAG: hypothetical protein GC181_09920 [Bacteroidetes bacterium]|nr:hypothetical protein [Bacteroidota bacterium]
MKLKFKKGDQVGLLNWSGYGTVIHVLENDRYLVLVEEADMEIPLHITEMYEVQNELVIKVSNGFNKESETKTTSRKNKTKVEEIDLHTENIPGNFKRNRTDIEAQLAFFEYHLRGAINQKKEAVIFIHGKGNGILKSKLIAALRERRFSFSDPERELNKKDAKLKVRLK